MARVKSVFMVAAAAGAVSAGEVIDFGLDGGQQVAVQSGPTEIMFGIEGNVEIDVFRDGDGKIADAALFGLDLNVLSASVYDFGALGLVTLSNIGVTLAQPGGQEYFFNETSGVPQPGDLAGFLDTDALADLTGTIELDSDRDGTADEMTDLSTLEQDFRRFDFEAMITRDGGSNVYQLTTFFELNVSAVAGGIPISFDIFFNGGGSGRLVPTPGSVTLAGLFIATVFRRRR